MRPTKPDWMNAYLLNKPLRKKYENPAIVIFSMMFFVGLLGAVAGTFISIISVFLNYDSIKALFALLIVGTVLGSSITGVVFVSKFIALSYGGSKTRQPVRKLFAYLLYKGELDKLERRVAERENYQKVLASHQAIIDRERKKLESRHVFRVLSNDKQTVTLDDNGRVQFLAK